MSTPAPDLKPSSIMGNEPKGSKKARSDAPKTYKGFVAGVFSGIAKLAVGHP